MSGGPSYRSGGVAGRVAKLIQITIGIPDSGFLLKMIFKRDFDVPLVNLSEIFYLVAQNAMKLAIGIITHYTQ